MLKRKDEKDLPIWLETNLERNVIFYEHFGFYRLEEIIIPKTNIMNWFMIRTGEI